MNCDLDVNEELIKLIECDKLTPSMKLENLLWNNTIIANSEFWDTLNRAGILLDEKTESFMEVFGDYYEDEKPLTGNTLLQFLDDYVFYDLSDYFDIVDYR